MYGIVMHMLPYTTELKINYSHVQRTSLISVNYSQLLITKLNNPPYSHSINILTCVIVDLRLAI